MKGLREIMAEIAQAGPPAPPDVFRCQVCEDTGFVNVTDAEDHARWRRCECAERELEANRRAAMVAWCELPAPMRSLVFGAIEVRKGAVGLAEAMSWLRLYAQGRQEQPWAWLDGPKGLAKTHLVVAVLNYRLEHPDLPQGKFVHVEDWLDHLRDGMADNSYSERFHLYCDVPLLVLDDLGAHQGTPWAVAKVDQLVDYRYRNKLPTLFTTNPTAQLPDRAADRMRDTRLCRKLNLSGTSYRLKGGA